jgi:hypothetical protein
MLLTRRTLVLGAMTAPMVARAQGDWPSANVHIVVAYHRAARRTPSCAWCSRD